METQAPAFELGDTVQISDLGIPPKFDEYIPLRVQPLQSRSDGQTTQNFSSVSISQTNAPALPKDTRAQSASNLHFDEGQSSEQHAVQLVQLLQQSINSVESLARTPLLEHLKRQADGMASTSDPDAAVAWQLTDDPAVEQAMQQCIQHPDFGREQDAVCGWLYEWSRSDAPVLQRFVARFAPDLARQYLFHCLSTQEVEPVPGLEACLIAIFEDKAAAAHFCRLPDLDQPSVHHTPISGKAGGKQASMQESGVLPILPTHSILPAGVAAFLGSPAPPSHGTALSGIRCWQRNAVAGAALRSFCTWMVTYTDAAITAFASLALSLASAGCPWLQTETQHVLQEQMRLGQVAQTVHTPGPSSTHRVQLVSDIVDPLCHGLGHAIYRLALVTQQTQAPSSSSLQPALGLIAEAVAALHVRTTNDLSATGSLLTQSLVPQIAQLYQSEQA